jgi:hypothetical protein
MKKRAGCRPGPATVSPDNPARLSVAPRFASTLTLAPAPASTMLIEAEEAAAEIDAHTGDRAPPRGEAPGIARHLNETHRIPSLGEEPTLKPRGNQKCRPIKQTCAQNRPPAPSAGVRVVERSRPPSDVATPVSSIEPQKFAEKIRPECLSQALWSPSTERSVSRRYRGDHCPRPNPRISATIPTASAIRATGSV